MHTEKIIQQLKSNASTSQAGRNAIQSMRLKYNLLQTEDGMATYKVMYDEMYPDYCVYDYTLDCWHSAVVEMSDADYIAYKKAAREYARWQDWINENMKEV